MRGFSRGQWQGSASRSHMWPFPFMLFFSALPLHFPSARVSSCSGLLQLPAFMENEHTVTYQTKVTVCNLRVCVCMKNGVVSDHGERLGWLLLEWSGLTVPRLRFELILLTASAIRAHFQDQYLWSLKHSVEKHHKTAQTGESAYSRTLTGLLLHSAHTTCFPFVPEIIERRTLAPLTQTLLPANFVLIPEENKQPHNSYCHPHFRAVLSLWLSTSHFVGVTTSDDCFAKSHHANGIWSHFAELSVPSGVNTVPRYLHTSTSPVTRTPLNKFKSIVISANGLIWAWINGHGSPRNIDCNLEVRAVPLRKSRLRSDEQTVALHKL